MWGIGEEEYSYMNGGGGFPWPPRSYTCTFCRKEFKSAQALGGHMNVHRRDRARLRQSPPPPPPPPPPTTTHHQGPMFNLNLNPNPNSSSTSCTSTTLPLFVATPSPESELKRWYHGSDACKLVFKKGEILRVDLDIGLPTQQHSHHDLDLELRLGTYSS